MSENCGLVHVPPVPERPIDLEQPAYVLVDGRWVDLGEVISRYAPGGGGGVLQIQSESIWGDNLALLTNTSPTLLHAPSTIVPTSPTSRLLVTGTVQVNVSAVPTTDVRAYRTWIGARHEVSAGIYDNGDQWIFRAARFDHDAKTTSSTLTVDTFALHRDFSVDQRRSDTGNWSIAPWGQNELPNVRSGAISYLQWTFTEYEPNS